MEADEILRHLFEKSRTVRSVVVSGGEPMLQHNQLIELLQLLKQNNYWIEVETNGTIGPTNEFFSLIDQVNCSPKLANSGNSLRQRERLNALQTLSASSKTNFKFVVSSQDDIKEILDLVERYRLQNVYLMPEGKTKEEQLAHQELVLELCAKYNFHFSPRLHILEFGNKRGV